MAREEVSTMTMRSAPLFFAAALAAAAACSGSAHPGARASGGAPGASGAGGASGGAPGAAGAGGASGSAPGAAGVAGASGGAPGAAGVGGAEQGPAGAGGAAAGGAGGGVVSGGCTDAVLRTGPPAGKEMYRTDPVDTKFPFSQHWVGVFSDDTTSYEANSYISMTSLSDIDHDGDLDFASGQRQDIGGGMMWWEYCSPDHWVRHHVGSGHTSAAGGNAADVDGDGWVDLLAGDSWYRNPKTPRAAAAWQRYGIGAPGAEELIVGEVTGDGHPDVLYVWRSIQPQYWTPGTDPTVTWKHVDLTTDTSKRQQQGGAIGDLDGDGDNDVVVGYQWWYRNAAGDGSRWEAVQLVASGFDNEPLTAVGDLDSDGDLDVAMSTHFGSTQGAARVAWAENLDGKGGAWSLHSIATGKSWTHAVVVADFDNDGDEDLFIGQNVGPQWIFENSDGHGKFVEHQIALDSRGHEARVGDVDCDGDLDIVGKPWGQASEGGEQQRPPRDHVYLKNELVERGGLPRFDAQRGPYELLPASKLRGCAAAPAPQSSAVSSLASPPGSTPVRSSAR